MSQRRQRPWPERYRVTLHLIGGAVDQRYVVTWLSAEKAIALAVGVYLHRTSEGDPGIYDVEVEDLGPAPRDADGHILIDRHDLTDRYEF